MTRFVGLGAMVALAVFGAVLSACSISIPARFRNASGAMLPTLKVGQVINVNGYQSRSVAAGDVIVFKAPPAEDCGGPRVGDLIKRVIGLPGETISVSGGYVDINGKRLNERWLPASRQGVTGEGPPGNAANLAHPYKIAANNYYVLGDNRMDSCDSRYYGTIPRSLIVGKVELP